MTTTIEIVHSKGTYPVHIGDGLFDRLDELLTFVRTGRVFVLTDENVRFKLADRIQNWRNKNRVRIWWPAEVGEDYKSWEVFKQILDLFVTLGIERGDTIIALGGGTVGDATGLAASAFKRGCNWVHVPTTVIAMVDSSVGGKTAINYAGNKNEIGSFHPPSMVVIDPTLLDTLPEVHMIAGFAEVIKYAMIRDPEFFDWIDQHAHLFFKGDWAAREEVIRRSIMHKGEIVAADEFERGDRALLNFGHTFGHALEVCSNFKVHHGEAVAVGMMMAMNLSVAKGLCPPEDAERLKAILKKCWLPTRPEAMGMVVIDGRELTEAMATDKKKDGGQVPLILSRGIGKSFVDRSTSLGEVATLYDTGQL